jgi:hypothetical protein
MIPSWRKRKALERKRRDQGLPVIETDTFAYDRLNAADPGVSVTAFGYRDDGYLAYCPNCGHRLDRVGHRFSCGGGGSVRGGEGTPSGL